MVGWLVDGELVVLLKERWKEEEEVKKVVWHYLFKLSCAWPDTDGRSEIKAIRYGMSRSKIFRFSCGLSVPYSSLLFARVAILCLEMTNRSFATDK